MKRHGIKKDSPEGLSFLSLSDFPQLFTQRGKVVFNNFPDQFEINALIIMDYPVSQALNVFPWDFRVLSGKHVVNLVCQLLHLTLIKDAGLHEL